MDIQLLLVPFDSGNRNARMGAGPERLLDVGLERTLRESGHNVHTRIAHLPPESWQAEIQTSFELMRMLATAVREAQESQSIPDHPRWKLQYRGRYSRRARRSIHRRGVVRRARRLQYSGDDEQRIPGWNRSLDSHRPLLDPARGHHSRIRSGRG